MDDYDLKTILINLHRDLSTRRLLLVGHSQGTYYTNAMYNYLLRHGMPREAIGVYNVATPAGFVEGGGKHLNSSGDSLLAWVRTMGFAPLENNLDLVATEFDTRYPGHSFSTEYLAGAPARVVGDIAGIVGALEPAMASEKGECFSAPEQGLAYQAAGLAYGAGDALAYAGKKGLEVGHAGLKLAAAAAAKLASDVRVTLAGLRGLGSAADGSAESRAANFSLIDKLYGSSLNNEELRELLGQSGGGAVIAAPLARAQEPPPPPQGEVAGAEDADPAPTRRYVSGTRGEDDKEEEVAVQEESPAEVPAEEPATTTEETPAPAEPAPAFGGGSPVEDDFDGGHPDWTTVENFASFAVETDSSQCKAGQCLRADGGEGGLGTGSQVPYIYQSGDSLGAGALSIWIRTTYGLRGARAEVAACSAAEEACVRFEVRPNIGGDSGWRQYLLAWRQGDTAVEQCAREDLDIASCDWREARVPLGTALDLVVITAFANRPDFGDNVWIDELEGYEP